MDRLFLGGQWGAGAESFEHVIHAGEREESICGLVAL
jgi:hypothetical protein